MSNITFSIDWLRFTIPYKSGTIHENIGDWFGDAELTEKRPILSYNMAMGNELFTAYWHTDHKEFKIMLEMTGKQLSSARKSGIDERDILRKAESKGAVFKRLDFAVDLFDAEANPMDVLECWRTDQFDTVAQSVSVVMKETRKERTGSTVYIGSRSSERLIRVYDKGKQSNTDLDWTRVELEAKGLRGDQLATEMIKSGVTSAGLSMLVDVVAWSDIDWWNNIFSGEFEIVRIDSLGRPETNRERWLRTVVVPVIEDELEAGNGALFDTLWALMQAYEDKLNHGPSLFVKKH